MSHLMHICIENKITSFDHAGYLWRLFTEAEFGKHLRKAKSTEKISLFLNAAFKPLQIS
jgi:hypothetical protein